MNPAPTYNLHATYINTNYAANKGNGGPTIYRNNIVTRNAFDGCQCRVGGIIDDNLFINNVGTASGSPSRTMYIANNIVTQGKDLDTFQNIFQGPGGFGANIGGKMDL